MPLKKGKSKKVIGENISEFHTGETYARTKKKFGKAKADKQAVAVAMSEARRSGGKKFGKMAGHNPPKPTHSAADYFVAGAKDFGEDVKSAWKGLTTGEPSHAGLSFKHRQKLMEEDAPSIPGAGHNPPKPHHARERAREKNPKAAHTSELIHHANRTHSEATGSPGAVSAKAAHTSELVHHAHHTHREVRGALGAVIPRHMRGRGLISEKAMALMSKQLAAAAKEPSGPHVATAAKSHAAKGDAKGMVAKHVARKAKEPAGPAIAAEAE